MSLSSVLVHEDSNQAIYLVHFSYALINWSAKSTQQPEKMRSALKISVVPLARGPEETSMGKWDQPLLDPSPQCNSNFERVKIIIKEVIWHHLELTHNYPVTTSLNVSYCVLNSTFAFSSLPSMLNNHTHWDPRICLNQFVANIMFLLWVKCKMKIKFVQ